MLARQSVDNTDRHSRRRANFRGHVAEYIAAAALVITGHRILARRYRSRVGEVDLIARRGGTVAFVEVKLRRSLAEAREAISESGCRRSRDAAEVWLSRRPRYQKLEQRFDAVLVSPWRWPLHLPGCG